MALTNQKSNRRSLLWSICPGICVALLAGCSLVLDFDKSLASDTDGGGTDANAIPDAERATDARNCAPLDPAGLEPNNIPIEATPLVGTIESVICATEAGADVDLFSFSVVAPQDVSITLTMSDSGGALDLRLSDSEGDPISESTGTSAIEKLTHNLANGNQLPDGTYFVEVFSSAIDTTEAYSISLSVGITK